MALIKNVSNYAVVLRTKVIQPGQEFDVEELLGANYSLSAFFVNAIRRGDLQIMSDAGEILEGKVAVEAVSPVDVEVVQIEAEPVAEKSSRQKRGKTKEAEQAEPVEAEAPVEAE